MKNKRTKISLFILVLWMILIFYMSNQPANISKQQSNFILDILEKIGINLVDSFGEVAGLVVRKLAHMTEYFIMYLLTYNHLYNFKKKIYIFRYIYFLSLIFTIVYAITDEIHQYFIPGRVMSFKDIFIDSLGAIIAMIFIKLISIFYRKKVI